VDPRKLKKLLDTLRDSGVQKVEFGPDLTPAIVEFSPMLPQPLGEVEGDTGDLELPPGVTDAAAALDRIRKAYEQKPSKGRAS
jgi:hypothetical protein